MPRRWLGRLREWFTVVVDKRRPFEVAFIDDAPDDVAAGTLYLVGDHHNPWSAVFQCPCGCNETIALSLIASDYPRWRWRRHWDGTVSLSPSVWRTRGCRSHFFVNRGKILWAIEDRPGRTF
jgi:hypothetical protein